MLGESYVAKELKHADHGRPARRSMGWCSQAEQCLRDMEGWNRGAHVNAVVWEPQQGSEYGNVRASAREVYCRDKAIVGMLDYACTYYL